MDSSEIDRMNAIILAKTISDRKDLLSIKGELETYTARLASYQMFSVGELSEISGLSEYQIRRSVSPARLISARSGVNPRHLDHLLRMIGDASFSKIHIKHLIDDGATFSAVSHITGMAESSLRRWV